MKENGYLKTIEQSLDECGCAVTLTKGTSMWPFLKEGKNQVLLVSAKKRAPKVQDVVLYRRQDGTLILHRIMQRLPDGSFLLCGDHQWKLEEKVKEEQILAVMEGVYRNEKFIDETQKGYQFYKKIWNWNLNIRRCMLAFLRISRIERYCLQK